MKKPITVYWLIPVSPYRELFRELVRILAERFDAPRFAPHLTLCAAQNQPSPKEVLKRIDGLAIRLRVREINSSAKFTETLFAEFCSSAPLRKLLVDLGAKTKSLRDPHVSLLYRKLPAGTRKELTAAIKLPFREVVFDSIQAVRCSSPTETRADVESWQVIATKRLSR